MPCYFCSDLAKERILIEEKFWNISVPVKQPWLGYCHIILKRHAGDLAELSAEEWMEFHEIVKKTEAALRQLFQPTLFNWSCLMNNAFQENDPAPHVHWHCRPRYQTPVIFEGIAFVDQLFGHHYDYQSASVITAEAYEILITKFKAAYQ